MQCLTHLISENSLLRQIRWDWFHFYKFLTKSVLKLHDFLTCYAKRMKFQHFQWYYWAFLDFMCHNCRGRMFDSACFWMKFLCKLTLMKVGCWIVWVLLGCGRSSSWKTCLTRICVEWERYWNSWPTNFFLQHGEGLGKDFLQYVTK